MRFWYLIPLLVALIAGSGCSPQRSQTDEAIERGILILGNGSEPKGLDPHLVTGVTENKIISALLEGLIAYHPTDDMEPAPGMAERWERNENATVWTFYLRESRWSNGDPVTAHDFVFSWQRMLEPTFGAEYANMLYIVQNAEAYHRGEIEDFSQVGVEALDSRTLRVTLRGPTPYFLSMLKHYSWFPINPAVIEKHGGMLKRDSDWTRPENYVGNGPFVLEEWVTNRIVRVVRNPDYWDAETVSLNEIHFMPIENANAEEQAFLAGQLHHTGTVPVDKIPFYKRNQPGLIRIEPYLGVYFYRFNVTREPLDDPRVRRALNLAIDRESIVENITKADQIPAYGYTPAGMQGYPTPQPLTYDVGQARRLLAEAGYPGGEGFPKVSLLFNTSDGHRRIAEAIQEMWKANLGIDIELENQEWKVYLDSQSNLDYDISRSGWIADYMDPITFLDMYTTGNGNNDTGWSNPRFDELINLAQESTTEEAHFQYLLEAERILLDELPVMPIYWYTRVYLHDPRVQGWAPKLLDNRPYKHVFFGER